MLYINGEWRESISGKKLAVTNPATGELIQEVAYAGREETRQAIEAAQAAFPLWKSKTAKERAQYMLRAAQIMRDNLEEIARVLTSEMGKPLPEARGEVNMAIEYIEWYAEEAKRIYGETIPASHPDKRILVLREPVGVTAAITPWNFPVSMITRKLAPALAAGCPMIIKPASATPLSAIKVVEAFHEAGIPKGVVNLVIGPATAIAGEMTSNPIVRKVTFTGSTEIGKELLRACADTVKKVSMELGGHAPFIVFEDADLDKAVDGALASKFRNAGQTCICTNRIFVQESIAEEFGKRFAEKVSKLKIGNGLEEGVEIGPLIDEAAVSKVIEHIEDAVQHGGQILCGGSRAEIGYNGHFFQPTVINYANEQMKIAREETFGPVAPIFTFKTEEEAIEKANNTNYGLAAYCYTKDLARAYRVMEALEYGIVGINDAIPTTAQAPFGGVKESGMGREGGRHGIEDYLEIKFVSINIG